MPSFSLHNADCLDFLKTMDDCSIDSIVTDPPYGISFMGKKWDYDVPSVDIWKECLRVLKPGGHLLAFAGTRTQHRMAVNIEDAGFEIRDMVAWVYGQGFPKSLDVSKAIDKLAGAKREIIGQKTRGDVQAAKNNSVTIAAAHANRNNKAIFGYGVEDITVPATPEAQQWEGWGTALKPSLEPITLARKPFKGTVAANVLEHGTGAINVNGCRVETTDSYYYPNGPGGKSHHYSSKKRSIEVRPNPTESNPLGRWPANLIHDGSDEVVGLFPRSNGQQGAISGKEPSSKTSNVFGEYAGRNESQPRNDSGSAARFFYSPKVSKKERGEGNNHPTVKPIALMAYLCRLVTPPNGTVLDPFMGSGSTGIAALQEGFSFVGVEREPEYLAIAERRIQNSLKGSMLR